MKKNYSKLVIGALVAIPLAVFAFVGSASGPLFANVASAGYGNGQEMVTVCHKGKVTLTVAAPAVPALLAQGDTLGACQ